MKQIRAFLGAVILSSLFAAAWAIDYPEGGDIKTDIVLTTNRRAEGVITRDNPMNVVMTVGSKEIKIPHSVIVAVYYHKLGSNEAYAAGVSAMAAKNWNEANGNLRGVNPNDLSDDGLKKSFGERLAYLRGLCSFHLGDYQTALKDFKVASTREEAPFRAEAMYYMARIDELKGDYAKASTNYKSLSSVTYKNMISTNKYPVEKWDYLARLGAARTEVLNLATKAGQEEKMEKAAESFRAVFKEGVDNEAEVKKNGNKGVIYFEDDVRMGGVQVDACAFKYLGKKSPDNYGKLVDKLKDPLRDAQVANDKAALAWMYLDRGDCYFGMMENAKDEAKRTEYGEDALLDYMRVTMSYTLAAPDLSRAFYRCGQILEKLKPADWESRALQYYRRATSPAYKSTPTFDAAKKAREELEKKAPAGDKK